MEAVYGDVEHSYSAARHSCLCSSSNEAAKEVRVLIELALALALQRESEAFTRRRPCYGHRLRGGGPAQAPVCASCSQRTFGWALSLHKFHALNCSCPVCKGSLLFTLCENYATLSTFLL